MNISLVAKLLKTSLVVAFICIVPFEAISQKMTWREHFELAEEAYDIGKYDDAARHYRSSWEMKPKKTDYIYKAGLCYALIKDFQSSTSCFIHVKNDRSKYPLAGYYYAFNLKQHGDYEEARREFSSFIQGYEGKDKSFWDNEVSREVKGCEMALEMITNPADNLPVISHLPESINSRKSELAPLPVGEEILYFSSTRRANKLKIYYSQYKEGAWTLAALPSRLPRIRSEHYGNGTLTPDNNRFYFTQCESISESGKLRSRCDLYMTERAEDQWSEPVRLRDYVNLEGTNNTHPNVIHEEGREIIYFTSDRAGGQGGLDIWFMTRDANSNDIDFTYPKNAGPKINTPKDEVSPFYNLAEGALYFGSNGHVGLGGYDIFRVEGEEAFWDNPVNVGIPINSSADDYTFVLKPSGKGGYLVSNRTFQTSKISTKHEDIFAFEYFEQDIPIYASGRVFGESTDDLLAGAVVDIYKIEEGTEYLTVPGVNVPEGLFKVEVEPEKEYRVRIKADGYDQSDYYFNTFGITDKVEMDIYMEYVAQPVDKPVVVAPVVEPEIPEVEYVPPAPPPPVVMIEDDKKEVDLDIKELDPEINPEDIEPIVVEDVVEETPEPSVVPPVITEVIPEPVKVQPEPAGTQPITGEVVMQKDQEEPEVIQPAPPPDPAVQRYGESYVVERNVESLTGTMTYKTKYGPFYTLTSSASRVSGSSYKIQFIALSRDGAQFLDLEDLGTIDTEFIEEIGLTRYLVSSFGTQDDAINTVRVVRNRGYNDAFLAEYYDGLRVGDHFNFDYMSYGE